MNIGGNILWSALEQCIRITLVFFINIAIARSLGPSDYGILSTIFALGGLLTGAASFGLDSICIRETAAPGSSIGRIALEVICIRLTAATILILLTISWVLFRATDIFSSSLMILLALMPLQMLGSTIGNIFAGKLLSKFATISLIIALLVASVLRIYGIVSKNGFIFFIYCYALEYALATIIIGWFFHKLFGLNIIKCRPSRAGILQLVSDAKWLFLSALAVQFLQNAGLLLLASRTSGAELGNYAASLRLIAITQFMPAMIGQSFIPAIIKAHDEGDPNLEVYENELFRCLAFCGYCITAVCVVAGPWLLPRLLGERFHGALPSFLILAVGSIPLSMAAARSAIFSKTRKYRSILVSDASGVVLISVFASSLGVAYGAEGIAMGTVAGYFGAYLIVPYFLMKNERSTRRRLFSAFLQPFPNLKVLFSKIQRLK